MSTTRRTVANNGSKYTGAAHILTKIDALGDALEGELFEREEEIHGFKLAILAKGNIFLVGLPGTGKTKLFDRATARISGAKMAGMLFTAHTRPEEVLGPLDIPSLRAGILKHNIAGYLPDSHVFKGDEIWKPKLLPNILLEALAEYRFKQGGSYIQIPLWSFLGTSNELPADETLDAIYDRFLLRFEVKPLAERVNRLRMLTARAAGTEPAVPDPLIGKDEIEAAQGFVRNVHVPESVLALIDDVGLKLTERNIDPSNRRLANAIPLVQAEAWLDGRQEAHTSDVQALVHVGWKFPEQIPEVETVVLGMTNPRYAKAIELAASVGTYSNEVEAVIKETDLVKRARVAQELQVKMIRAAKDINLFAGTDVSGRTLNLILKSRRTMLTSGERLMTEVMHLSSKAAKIQAQAMAGEDEDD